MITYFKRLRIGTALTAMLIAFVLTFAVGGFGGLRLLQSASDWVDELGRDNVVRAHALSDVAVALLRAQTLITDARIQMESGMEETRDALLGSARRQLELAAARFVDFSSASAQDDEGADTVVSAYEAWVGQGLEPWWTSVQGWNGLAAQQLERERVAPDGQAFLQAVASYQDEAREQGAATAHAAAGSLELARTVCLVLLCLVMGLALACRVFIGRMVLRPLAEVGSHLRAIAAGHLDGHIITGSGNEIGSLQQELHGMQKDLRSMVLAIRASAGAIEQRLDAMLQENRDLSFRTQEQASSLEHTAARIEQLAGLVQENARHAAMASTSTRQAAETAQRAGRVTGEVVNAMEAMVLRSQEIGDIVKVIDEVAFQTTLLSHNAAIEAAHAGEYGKGFAVVASAVQQLARRSTDAAAQVRRLSEAARIGGEAGMREVNRAGAIMQEVVTVVQQATQLAQELADSAQQQSQGIAEINVTVGQLDGMTQQNASLVDSASQSARALSEQTLALRGAVSVFSLSSSTQAMTQHRAETDLIDVSQLATTLRN